MTHIFPFFDPQKKFSEFFDARNRFLVLSFFQRKILKGGTCVSNSQSLALSGFLIKTSYIGVVLAEKHESGFSFDRDITKRSEKRKISVIVK